MTNSTEAHHAAVAQLTASGAPFEVIEHEIADYSVPAYKNAPAHLSAYLQAGREHGDNPFLQYQGQVLSFNAFFDAVDKMSGYLAHSLGIKPGERVALAMRNRPEWGITFTAALQIGAVVVPLNSWGKGEELEQGLMDSNARLVVCDSPRFNYIRSRNVEVTTLLVDPGPDDQPDIDWQTAVVSELSPPTVNIRPEDPALLLFTSGTSGRPKGAAFSHFTCCQALMNVEFIGAATYMTNTETIGKQSALAVPPKTLLAVPLFHISGLFSQFVANLRHGRCIHMMYKWDAREALRLVKEEGITVLMGAPAMMLELLQLPEARPEDFVNIANISAGGAATPDVLHKLFLHHLTHGMGGAGWGMTETGGTGAAFTGQCMHERPGSSGFPSPIMTLSFRDEDGREVEPGTPGEIWLRSGAAIQGYVGQEGASDDFVDGWFKTGDIGYISDEGLLYLCGRAKDMIIRGGENVYPAEVEAVLLEYPGCIEAGVVGIPSEHWGEEVAAVLRMQPGADNTIEKLQQHCAQRLAGFKVPVQLVFAREPLPRNATQKLLKRALREQYFPN